MDGSLKGHNHAKAAIDIACWDIFGKSVNMPVSALLGKGHSIKIGTLDQMAALR